MLPNRLFYKISVFKRKNVGMIAFAVARIPFRLFLSSNCYFMPIFEEEGLGSSRLTKWWKIESWESEELKSFLSLQDPYQAMSYLRTREKIVVD